MLHTIRYMYVMYDNFVFLPRESIWNAIVRKIIYFPFMCFVLQYLTIIILCLSWINVIRSDLLFAAQCISISNRHTRMYEYSGYVVSDTYPPVIRWGDRASSIRIDMLYNLQCEYVMCFCSLVRVCISVHLNIIGAWQSNY